MFRLDIRAQFTRAVIINYCETWCTCGGWQPWENTEYKVCRVFACDHWTMITDGSLEEGGGRFLVMQPAGASLQLVENIFGITAGILKYNEE